MSETETDLLHDCTTALGVATNDKTPLLLANDTPLADEEAREQLFRELREIGWYDKEIRGPHHDQALRIWWGKTAPSVVAIVAGCLPSDPVANDF